MIIDFFFPSVAVLENHFLIRWKTGRTLIIIACWHHTNPRYQKWVQNLYEGEHFLKEIDSGGSPGLENAVKRWGWLRWFLFLFTSMQACEKHMSKPGKNVLASPLKTLVFNELTPYGVGRYYDMALSPTGSHLLWTGGYYNTKIVHHIMVQK